MRVRLSGHATTSTTGAGGVSRMAADVDKGGFVAAPKLFIDYCCRPETLSHATNGG